MEKGLLWLPLLFIFTGLAWAGRREFQKIEVYRQWSSSFEQAKFDIYSVLGLKDGLLIYGKPTYQAIIDEKIIFIEQIKSVELLQDNKVITDFQEDKSNRSGFLCIFFKDSSDTFLIPFTELSLASKWKDQIQSLIL
jgi:hypothetical protein